ncbi:MAG TPA: hypothetical protein VK879_09890 [Candidatus Sulfomarinibacteraceae bacterium]|nr:hypothetical protein [Candidatus Sulfomarinibacteraceae bacterium]
MSKRISPIRWILILGILISLPALACNLVTGEQPDPLPGAEESGESQPPVETSPVDEGAGEVAGDGEDTPGTAPELRSLTAALAEYNSYRVNMSMRFEATDSDAGGAMRMESARIVEPPASSMTIYFEGDLWDDAGALPEEASISFAEVEGTTYTVLPGFGCVSGSAGDMSEGVDEFGDLMDADEILGQLDDLEYVGRETIDGQSVDHYHFTEENMADAQNLREVNGDLYVSREEGYVVRMVMDGVGTMEFLGEASDQEGTLHMEYDVSDVGASFDIEIPEGCGQDGSGLPVMDGATDMSTFGSFTSYTVEASLEDAVTFYQRELSALGYEEPQELLMMEDTAMLLFEGPDLPAVTVNLTVEEDGIAVMLSSEPGE